MVLLQLVLEGLALDLQGVCGAADVAVAGYECLVYDSLLDRSQIFIERHIVLVAELRMLRNPAILRHAEDFLRQHMLAVRH